MGEFVGISAEFDQRAGEISVRRERALQPPHQHAVMGGMPGRGAACPLGIDGFGIERTLPPPRGGALVAGVSIGVEADEDQLAVADRGPALPMVICNITRASAPTADRFNQGSPLTLPAVGAILLPEEPRGGTEGC